MKKILFICNHFAPDNAIAAIRTTKLVKYFVKAGFYVKVIAEKKHEQIVDEILKKDVEGVEVIRIDNSKWCKKILKDYKKFIEPCKNKRMTRLDNRMRINPKTGHEEFYPYETAYPFLGTLDYIAEIYRQKDLYIQSKPVLDKQLDFDVVITSYGDRFSLYAGAYVKKKNKNIKWIFDIRDAICRYKFVPKYMFWYAFLSEKYIEKKVDFIVAVSEGIAQKVHKKYKDKVNVITNGYDWGDREGIVSQKQSSKLIFTYTGSMYGGLQDLTPFFKALEDLISQNVIDETKIEVDYAGNETAFEIFCEQARKYHMEHLCCYQGKLERKESLRLQTSSDILLLASYDYAHAEGGVITGKALEYMSAQRPVITIVNGDIKNSELKRIIECCQLGVVYEQSNAKEDYLLLKQYIEDIYIQFEKTQQIIFNSNLKMIEKFNYEYLSKKYLCLINGEESS